MTHERVVPGHLAAVKIHAVRPERDLGDAVTIFLAAPPARVLRLKAVEPLALIFGIENFPPTSARTQFARLSAVEMMPPAAKAAEGFCHVSSLGLSVPAVAAS